MALVASLGLQTSNDRSVGCVSFVCLFLGDGVYEDQIAGYEDGCRGQAGGDMGEVGLVPGGVEEPADQEHGEDSQP